ncbi:MAG: bifunctional UDP-sugar hydrolase/5'-nucleotidase [Clostridium sp.]
MSKLKIYFTSDIHGFIYPTDYANTNPKNIGLLNIINSFEKDENTLIIDCGDTIQGSPFTTYLSSTTFEDHPIAKVMNEGGYDYVTLGNHDFNYGYDYLSKYIKSLNAKCICANVVDKTGELPIFQYDIKTLSDGTKIGLIGFTTDFITTWEREENIKNFEILPTFEAVKEVHDSIKNNVDLLIGIYHGGFEYDLSNHKKLSETSENIAYKICEKLDFDILLTGHQHMEISNTVIHGTHIVQPPHYGSKFAQLIIDDKFTSSLKEVSLNPNKKLYNELLPLENNVQKWLDTPVGHLDVSLQPTSHIDMAVQGSNLANFINQIQLEVSGADIACTSFANSIKGFDKDVTVRDIVSTYIYPNTLVVLKVTGEILKKALERSASYFDKDSSGIKVSDLFLKPKVEHYNYDYFTNIKYTIDLNKEINNRVTSILYNGNEIKPQDTFTLVMNNYRASGAGGYEFYKDCPIVKEILTEMPEIIINYFRNHTNVIVDKSKYINIKI